MPFDYGQGSGAANANYQQQGQQYQQQAQQAANNIGNGGDWEANLHQIQSAAQQAGELQKQHDRPNYGGYAGGANDAANYYKSLGEQYAGAKPIQADTTLVGEDRTRAEDATGLLRNAAYGNAPSAAENQFNRSLSQSIMAQQAGANSARGGGANLAAAQGQAAMQSAQMQNAGAQQAAIIRAQEMERARSAYLGATQQQQGLDAGVAFNQANLGLQSRQVAQQGQLQASQLGEQAQQAQLNADTSRYSADVGAQTAQNQLNAQQSNNTMSAITGMAGAGLALLSDISKKDQIAPAGGKMAEKEFKSNPILNAAGNALAGYGAGLSGQKFTPIQGINAKKEAEMLDARAGIKPNPSYSPMYPSGQAPPGQKPPLAQVMAQPPAPAPMGPPPGAAPPQDMPLPPAMYQYMKGLNGGEMDQSKWKITPEQAPPPPVPPAYVGSPAYVPSDERLKVLMQPAGQEKWFGRGLLTGHADPNRDYPMHEVGFRKEQYPAGIMSDERAKRDAFREGINYAREVGTGPGGVLEETGRVLDSNLPLPSLLRARAMRNESIGQGIPEGRHKEMREPRDFHEGTQVVHTGKTEPYEPSYSPREEPYVPPQLPRPPPPPPEQPGPHRFAPRTFSWNGTPEQSTEADEFLKHLHPYSYRYKDSANEPATQPTGGRYLGVMAQDLEKTPYGEQLVKDTPRGKMLEHGAVTSAALAGLGRLHERVARLEFERAGQAAGRREK